jgi:multidrug efflux system outer membrane protein
MKFKKESGVNLKKAAILIIALSLISCVEVPKISRNGIDNIPPVSFPKDNKNEDMTLKFSSDNWWKMYKDPVLNELVDISLASNKELKIARLNIQKSAENIYLAKSQNSLYVDMSSDLQRERTSEHGLTPPPYGGSIFNFGNISLQSSYSIDLFNKFGSLTKEAKYAAIAETLNSEWVELNVTNQVAKLYGYYIYLTEEENNLSLREGTLKELESLEKDRIAVGKGVKESLLEIQQELRNTQSLIKVNTLNQQLTENNLNLITGLSNPDRIKSLLEQVKKKPNLSIYNNIKIPGSISSDIIRNRPDVGYYLMIINAQEAKLDSLKADFYPQFSITGQAGLQSIGFNNLLKSGSFLGVLGASIYLPIFDSGRIKSNYKIAGTDLNIFIEQYNKSVLNAYEDVNNNLLKVKTSWSTIKLDDSNLKSQSEILERDRQRLNLGKIAKYDYVVSKHNWLVNVLDNKQKHYSLYSKQIDLINSLGGSYSVE